jgi:hypothetical protein
MYLDRLGAVAHYNVDKALLIAGQSRSWFGGGQVTQPVQLVLGDRATLAVEGKELPVEETARGAIDGWLARHCLGSGRTSRRGSPSRPNRPSSAASLEPKRGPSCPTTPPAPAGTRP